MPRGKGGPLYDEDDMYDEEYDEYDDYGDYDDEPAQQPARGSQQQQKAGAGKGANSSVFAQTLRTAPAAASRPPASFPAVPQPPAGGPAPFDFSTPSPDQLARTAGVAPKPAAGVFLAPSKTPTVAAARQQIAAKQAAAATAASDTSSSGGGAGAPQASGAAAATAGLAGLQLGRAASLGGASSSSGGGPEGLGGAGSHRHHHDHHAESHSSYRPLGEYKMEPDLEKEVKAALATAAAITSAEGGRTPLHLVVMGHVDAGKSTLMGRLLHDLGYVSQKDAHKNAREAAQAGKASFSWAWVLDERPEERSRGVTVDIAMARFSTPHHTVTLLDAPGHRDFVPNMISGAAQADAAVLLVDGSPGGFEAGFEGDSSSSGAGYGASYGALTAVSGGQTKEHAQLARALGVEQLAVVISKLDTCDYSQERFEYIKAQLLPFLKTCGFKEASIQWLPAVGPLGLNLVTPPTSEPLLSGWWKGPTVVGAIDAFQAKPRLTSVPLRMPVHDVARGKHGQVSVGGKLEAGALKVGSRVLLLPGREVGTVKQLEVDGQAASVALAGDSVDVTVSGVEPHAAWQGSILCHPDFPVRCATTFEARVLVLEVPIPILKGHSVTLHAHTAREEAVVSSLVALVDPKTGAVTKQRPRCLMKGQSALVQITVERPVCLEVYTDFRALGRVALREGGRTIALGLVTQVVSAA